MVHADMDGADRGAAPPVRMSARRSTKQPRGRAGGASRGGARQRGRPLSGCAAWQAAPPSSQLPKKFNGLKCRVFGWDKPSAQAQTGSRGSRSFMWTRQVAIVKHLGLGCGGRCLAGLNGQRRACVRGGRRSGAGARLAGVAVAPVGQSGAGAARAAGLLVPVGLLAAGCLATHRCCTTIACQEHTSVFSGGVCRKDCAWLSMHSVGPSTAAALPSADSGTRAGVEQGAQRRKAGCLGSALLPQCRRLRRRAYHALSQPRGAHAQPEMQSRGLHTCSRAGEHGEVCG